jgi:HlyD family secretion protein
MKKILPSVKSFITGHKVWTTIIILMIIIVGYEVHAKLYPTTTVPQYTLSRVRTGNIVQTVTGTGQVSAKNQLSINSQVSGTIESINVKVGQHVHTGDLIATIDPTNALNSLTSAKIALAKLTEAPKTTDLSNAQNSVTQSYGTAFNAITNTFIDLQTVIPGLNSLLYGRGDFLSDQSSSYLNSTARLDRNQTGMNFDNANIQYQKVITEYKSLTRQSATTTISQVLEDTYALAKNVSNTLQNAQNTITYITTYQPDYLSKDAATAQTNVTTWSNSINSDLSSLLSAQTGIASAQNSLTNLVSAPDALDLQSAQLTLDQAQQTYNNYFIRAPFDGVIGLLPVSVYDQAGNGTNMATIISDQKIATLSLNEVDASSVKVGDPVTLTFNAISDLTATGTVSEVDLVGTVSSGVVSYGVKVLINTTDSRINPGMSVNATIVTKQIDNVIIVPSSAVKTQGNRSYVQTFDASVVSQYVSDMAKANGISLPTNSNFGSTTRQYNGTRTNGGINMTTTDTPTNKEVTIGTADSSNTEIMSGLSTGDWVITKTTNGTSNTTTATPSLLNSFGGRGGGFNRTVRGG